MGRRGPVRCNGCGAHVVFFGSPFTGKRRTFDPTSVDDTHPLAGVKAFPVLGGTRAYKQADLVELLQVQRRCSDVEAADEVRDMPWHVVHECPPADHDGSDQ